MPGHIPILSPRQAQIRGKIASGHSNQEIAEDLGISLHTVKTHSSKIYKKLSAPNRLQAVLWYKNNMR
jgi:LuxR family maltose regulon positive regulatory protein